MKKIEFSLAAVYIFFYTIFLMVASEIMTLIEPHNYRTFFDGLWWSVVTATTVGYGDMVPHTEAGRMVAIVIIVGGVIAVAAFTALMTSQLVTTKIFAKKGYENLEGLEHHLVICGFKTPRKEVLEGFKEKYGERIVIIYPELSPELEKVLEENGLKFVQGEYNDELALREARIEKADKVMILNMHDEYADAKVLETVIVIRSLNSGVYIIAEINDAKFENYLIKSRCDEIIMSEEYNRFLLSKSISEPGMSKVIRNLLRTQNFHIITKHPFEGKRYAEAFEESIKKNQILLGVVKNYITGTQLKHIVLNKIRYGNESEKYKELLGKIKRNEIEMEVLINPEDDFIIPEFSAIIIMER
ncbi:potassium channel family protein [Nitratifractor salsuginis]|uniref:Ion transport 2 domain protein n=1 Tax=Nitratifractor salsuginis (strain DSM 16511 / JCM 12458 / E9I37-1) TaxID=749222 RepID=E6X118_NITSE|nr:potassium channel family protein [Nitratifractor salsuginis]ADV45821.1 Ion transport 2 domain protein [Nitratifractor salsuginis DSM 16511]